MRQSPLLYMILSGITVGFLFAAGWGVYRSLESDMYPAVLYGTGGDSLKIVLAVGTFGIFIGTAGLIVGGILGLMNGLLIYKLRGILFVEIISAKDYARTLLLTCSVFTFAVCVGFLVMTNAPHDDALFAAFLTGITAGFLAYRYAIFDMTHRRKKKDEN